ncbi:uncharacterized protein LOC135389829 [Ornithodoros turicata]|uniref:uncharacterized protein LOC135389829 n=1 Tax=Ornithodoros turicata TaxID=34597 RepID=UPI003139AFE8
MKGKSDTKLSAKKSKTSLGHAEETTETEEPSTVDDQHAATTKLSTRKPALPASKKHGSERVETDDVGRTKDSSRKSRKRKRMSTEDMPQERESGTEETARSTSRTMKGAEGSQKAKDEKPKASAASEKQPKVRQGGAASAGTRMLYEIKHKSLMYSITGFASIFMFAVLAMVFVMIYFRKRRKSVVPGECTTDECEQLLESVTNFLDKNVDPCKDFYGYVCSRWKDLSATATFVDETESAYYAKIHDGVLSEVPSAGDRFGRHILVGLYNACYVSITQDHVMSLQDVVNESSKFLNISSLLSATDFSSLVEQLSRISLTLAVHSTFSLGYLRADFAVYFHVRGEKSLVHKIASASKGRIRPNNPLAERYIKEVTRSLQIVEVNQVLQLDTFVYEVTDVEAATTLVNFTDVHKLLQGPSEDVLLQLVNSIGPSNRAVRSGDPALVTGYEMLQRVQEALRNAPMNVSTVYVSLHLLMDTTIEYFMRNTGPKLVTARRTCARVAEKALGYNWRYLVSAIAGLHRDATLLKIMGRSTKSFFLDHSSWMDPSTRKMMNTSLQDLDFFTYDPEDLKPTGADYSDFQLPNGSYTQMYFEVRKLIVSSEILSNEAALISGWHDRIGVARFTDVLRKIMVPSVYQFPPMYYTDADVPSYINYATIGVLMANEMVRSFGTRKIQWSPTGMQKLNETLSCLKSIRDTLDLKESTEFDGEEIFAWTYGSRVTYETLKGTMKLRGEKVYKEHWSTAEYYFLIRFCMLSCVDHLEDSDNERQRCMVPVLSNPRFWSQFKCNEAFLPPCLRSSVFGLVEN